MKEPDQFELMQELDKLSELREVVDPRYAPIVDAKINYRLQQAYKEKEPDTFTKFFKKEREHE